LENKKFLGEKIAIIRSQLKLNRQEFIDKLNNALGTSYSTQALYSWEKGKSIPPADLVPPLASLLKISILELYIEDFSSSEDVSSANEELRARVNELQAQLATQKEQNLRMEGKLETSDVFIKQLVAQLKEIGKSGITKEENDH